MCKFPTSLPGARHCAEHCHGLCIHSTLPSRYCLQPTFYNYENCGSGSGVFPKVTHLVEGRTEDYHSNPDPTSILHGPHLACSVFLAQSTAKLCTLLPLLLQQNKRDIRSGNKTQIKHFTFCDPAISQGEWGEEG